MQFSIVIMLYCRTAFVFKPSSGVRTQMCISKEINHNNLYESTACCAYNDWWAACELYLYGIHSFRTQEIYHCCIWYIGRPFNAWWTCPNVGYAYKGSSKVPMQHRGRVPHLDGHTHMHTVMWHVLLSFGSMDFLSCIAVEYPCTHWLFVHSACSLLWCSQWARSSGCDKIDQRQTNNSSRGRHSTTYICMHHAYKDHMQKKEYTDTPQI